MTEKPYPAVYPEPTGERKGWVSAGVFLDRCQAHATATAYPPPTWARLRQIKARYDPDNVFRRNHNVPPASRPSQARAIQRATAPPG